MHMSYTNSDMPSFTVGQLQLQNKSIYMVIDRESEWVSKWEYRQSKQQWESEGECIWYYIIKEKWFRIDRVLALFLLSQFPPFMLMFPWQRMACALISFGFWSSPVSALVLSLVFCLIISTFFMLVLHLFVYLVVSLLYSLIMLLYMHLCPVRYIFF